MRIKVMVVALAGVMACWSAHAEEPIEQVVISGDKLKRTEIDSSASVGARNRRQIDESGMNTVEEVISQMASGIAVIAISRARTLHWRQGVQRIKARSGRA